MRIKLAELRVASGRGIGFTAAQATVAAAALAVFSGIGGAFIQSITTRDVEAGKSTTALSLEKTKVDGGLELERQKQMAAAVLTRQEFETKLILKAIETPDREEAIRNLQFFLSAGFIQDKDGKIANLQASEYPSITPQTQFVADNPGDALIKFIFPNGALAARDQGHAKEVTDFMAEKNITDSLTLFLRSTMYATQRAELAQRLRARGLIP
jgi:hypothetical protein